MRKNGIIVSAVLICGIFTSIFGQNSDNKNDADNALRGSGRINPSTLGMEIDIPLGSYPGRGIVVPVSLSYSSKLWRMEFMGNLPVAGGNYSSCYENYRALYAEESASGWTSSLAVPYIEYTGAENFYNADGTPISYDDLDCPDTEPPPGAYPYHYVKRLVVHLPSGETHELRASDAITSFAIGGTGPSDPAVWNTTFYAVDGSNIKYVQDSTTNLYRLQMPDGSFYDFNYASGWANKASKFTDRNGNYTTYHAPDANYPNGYWTDTLGKIIPVPIKPSAPSSPTTSSSPQVYSMPGMTGSYKFQWKLLKGSSEAESGLTNFSLSLKPVGDAYFCYNGSGYPSTCVLSPGNSLFGGGGGSTGPRVQGQYNHNPIVLTEIELPTGTKYKFSYDIYGRIETITYPTGAKEEFIYSAVATLSVLNFDDLTGQANFGVTDRKVYPTGSGSNYHWTYSANHTSNPQGYQVTINNPDGTKIERIMHRGSDPGNSFGFGYDTALAGMVFEERGYNSASPQVLVSKNLTTWTKTDLATSGGASTAEAQWHPRPAQQESQIFEGGSGVSTTSKFYYEGDLSYRDTPVLQNKVEQYAFVTAGSSPPSNPIRTTETTYLINDPNYSSVKSYYTNQNMTGLATASVVKDGAGTIVSRSETAFDESGYSPNVGRGNPTTSRVWDSTKGVVTNSSAYISTRAKFDTYGNRYEAIDARGCSTTTTFDSTYNAFPVSVTSCVPSDGTHGSNTAFVTYATFDTTTGLPLTATDANGLETRITYDAATLRPLNTKTYYQNNQIGGTSEIVYHDETNNYWVKNRTQIDTDKWTESITYFDGLGRAFKGEEINSQGNIFVEKEFDDQGRIKRVTNPYRSGETKQWTTNTYDQASRIKEVTMPDGSKVITDYGLSTSGIIGVTKQITDQASKKRKGISDALGRMVRVIEDPNGTPLETDYVFDTLGNLRKTIQGEQSRYFAYDSLGRLLYARQPEQEANTSFSFTDPITSNSSWSVKYQYDDNGNITSTTDAKGVSVTGTYDNFNRIKTRAYNDNPATPGVSFYYDGKGLPSIPAFSKGKTTKVASSVSETRYTSFDIFGRLLSSEQRTPFGTETAENATPRVSSNQFDAFGKLLSETYPSGRTVQFNYNQDGDVSSVWGTVGGNNRIYANGFSYNSSGAIERFRFGNGKWETHSYNNRLQITEIALGNSAADKTLLKLEYGYGTQNNGNMRSQKISFNGLSQPFEQTYEYDSLNRLQSAEEKVNTQTTWKQTFAYDRYGNRRFDAANTTTLGSCSQAVCNPLINTSNNRFSSVGQNYSYDANGNLTADAEGKQFLYDAENHQKEVKNSSSQSVGQYFYDGEGKRVKKVEPLTNQTTIFVYDGGGKLVAEYSTELAASPQVSYLTADHLGSPRVITDQNGAVTTRKDYAAFGEETFTAQRTSSLKYDVSETRKGYTGYEKDSESGLDFAEARYYNSAHGRFTSVDPLTASANVKDPQTFNRYTYALNSPYKLTDPLGLSASDAGSQCGTWCVQGSYTGGTNMDDLGAQVGYLFWAKDPPPPREPDTSEEDGDCGNNPSPGCRNYSSQDDEVTNPEDLDAVSTIEDLSGNLRFIGQVGVYDRDFYSELQAEARWYERYWLAYYENVEKAFAAAKQFGEDHRDSGTWGVTAGPSPPVGVLPDGRVSTPALITWQNSNYLYENPAKKFADAANAQLAAIRAREKNGDGRFVSGYADGKRIFSWSQLTKKRIASGKATVSKGWVREQYKKAASLGAFWANIRRLSK